MSAEDTRELARAEELARNRLGRQVRVERAEAARSYGGQVIGVTDRYVVQEHDGRTGTAIIHDRQALNRSEDLTGEKVEISYPYGSAGIVREHLTEFDRMLLAREREARDQDRQLKADAYAEVRMRTGRIESSMRDGVLAEFERSAEREAAVALRRDDQPSAEVMREKAGVYAEARTVLADLRDREGIGRDGDRGLRDGRDGVGGPQQTLEAELDR